MIAQQLEPYIRSITAMMERVQPEVAIKKIWTNIKTKVMFDKRSNRERCCRWQQVLERRWRWWSQVEDKDRRRDCEDTRTSGSLPFSSGSRPLSRSISRGVCLTATINIHPQVKC